MHFARHLRLTRTLLFVALLGAASLPFAVSLHAQEGVTIFSGGNASDRIRVASAGFKPASGDPHTQELKRIFDKTLFDDLAAAGIFDVVSKSAIPHAEPASPGEIALAQWSAAPASASMVAFGSLALTGQRLAVNAFLDDTKNTQFPQVLAKQYNEEASPDSAREIAHRFADEIILRLGGSPGIAETKIYYVHLGGGNKEIYEMDYDGANQHAVTHLGTVSLSPRVSPDNTRLAFSSLGGDGFQIKMYSLLLGRMVAFPVSGGTNLSPAWSPDGKTIAYSSSRSGDPEIFLTDVNGAVSRRITNFRGPDVSPVFNPRTGAQIAWISGRTGLPQLYIMENDGSSVQRLTDSGYATSPSWSPNGQFVAFAWNRKYGPGAPGGQDIYVMEISTKRWIQLTHDQGRCDFPSWSPDGRHIVFACSPDGRSDHSRVVTMLADGADLHPLTGSGADMPNWSWK